MKYKLRIKMKSRIEEYRLTSIPGGRAVFARGILHNFSRHAHESYIIGMVVRGSRIMETAGAVQRIDSGGIFHLRPFQQHSCCSLGQESHDYLALALSSEQLRDVCSMSGHPVAQAFTELFYLVGRIKLTQDILKVMVMEAETVANDLLNIAGISCIPRQISKGLGFIGQNYNLRLSLEDIAEYSCMSKYNFQRVFTRYIGMSPADAVAKKRVYSALRLICEGETASRAALECGFSDQSHLCRMVKKLTGVTVRNYISAVEEV